MAILRFHVVPNAKVDSVIGEHGAAIKVKLRAPAVEGKANAALRSFLSKELEIAERQIVLERGHKITRQNHAHRQFKRARGAKSLAPSGVTIAHRFNAGKISAIQSKSHKGRKKASEWDILFRSCRDWIYLVRQNPALKHWAVADA